MSITKGIKNIGQKDLYNGFGRPFNGLPFNDPINPLAFENPGPIDLNPAQPGSSLFNVISGGSQRWLYKGFHSCIEAYKKCPPLSTIINKKAQAHINGKTWVLGIDGKLSDSTDGKKIRKLLKKPNPIQTWKQFSAQQKIYMQTFGFCLVLPIIPAGFKDIVDASSLWNIPPYMIDVKETKKLFNQTDISGMIEKITLDYKGEKTDLPMNDIGFFKDFTPSFDTLILPASRIELNQQPINIIIGALESQEEVISYAGSQGLLTPDNTGGGQISIPLRPEQKEQLQADFKRQYGIRRGQFRYIISPAALKWQSMGVDPKKLMLVEFVQEASIELCDGWNYPPHLMGLIDPTFNNQAAAEKGLYQNTIIPESESIDEEWNLFFKTEDRNIVIETDFSHLAILQEDQGAKATARMTLDGALKIEYDQGLITLDEWLIELGMEPLKDGRGKLYITDTDKSKAPLASMIGVGGVTGMIAVLTAQGLSAEARQSILEVVFGVSPADAARMVVEPEIETPPTDPPIPPIA